MAAGSETRPQLARRLAVAIQWRVAFANVAGAALTLAYFSFLAPGSGGPTGFDHDDVVSIGVFAAYMIVAVAVGFRWGTAVAEPAYRWGLEDREPTDEEREHTLQLPARLAVLTMAIWVGAAAVFGLLNGLAFAKSIRVTLGVVVGTLVAGVTTSAICFLLVESAMRPAVARALAGGPADRPGALGIRWRLALVWLLGSAVPLLTVGLTPVGLPPSEVREVTIPLLFLTVVGVVTGAVIMWTAGRSLAEPVTRVTHGLRLVQRGRLDVAVEVDDSGELGVLQAGFNGMVAELRERQRLQDLFGRYVGEDVARQALERTAGLGGEERDASAMFVDLIGSTALSRDHTPEEVVELLNAFFGAVVAAVGAEGGWVNKFEGDGALCVFGAPRDQPDHATRALRAARRLRAVLHDLAVVHPDLDAGLGVSCGRVVAGNVGAERRFEYTVIGDPVNEAARLTEAAKSRTGRLLASAATVAQAEPAEARQWIDAGLLLLRGRDEPTEVCQPRKAIGPPTSNPSTVTDVMGTGPRSPS